MSDVKSVLIIDDNAQTRLFISAALTREGYVTTEAATSADAVESLRNGKFTVILLDFKMPHDGVAMIDYLSDAMPEVLARTIVLIPAVNRPIWATLPKPLDPAALLRSVASCAAQ